MDKAAYLRRAMASWATCQGCMLCQQRQSVVYGYGNADAQILVVGEAPGAREDREGLPFVGTAGDLLDKFLSSVSARPEIVVARKAGKELGQQEVRSILLESTFYTNVVACRPPENRDPTPTEINTCRPRLHDIIYAVDPDIILGVGRLAVTTLISTNIPIIANRGRLFEAVIPGRIIDVTYPVIALLHPSFLLRRNDFTQDGGLGYHTYFDFLQAMRIVDRFNLYHHSMPEPKDRPQEKRHGT